MHTQEEKSPVVSLALCALRCLACRPHRVVSLFPAVPQTSAKKLFINYLEAKGDVDFSAFCALLQYMAPGKAFAKGVLVQLFEQVRVFVLPLLAPPSRYLFLVCVVSSPSLFTSSIASVPLVCTRVLLQGVGCLAPFEVFVCGTDTMLCS